MQSATLSTSVSKPRTLSPEDVVDSTAALAETYRRPDTAGVCVVDGFGCRIRVERGALEVHDGVGQHRRTRRYDRATHGLHRLVILNAAGMISLEALRWCQALGIGVLVIGADGTAQLASTLRMTDDARLRRTQALAPSEPYGLDVARWLISRKLVGQGKLVLRCFGDSETAETIGDLALAVEEAATVDEVRQLEASAAALYFGAWSGRSECEPMFAVKDRRRIPPHWSRYEGRRSVLASGNANRKAERPVNVLLNYAYALVEAEAILACQAVGLDAGLGLVHSDTRGRQSLALEIMEPVRPEVDAFVLDLIERRTFRKVDFAETSDGARKAARAVYPRAGRDDAAVGRSTRPDRRARRPCIRQGNGGHVLGGNAAHAEPYPSRAGGRESAQGIGADCRGVVDRAAEAHQCEGAHALVLPRLRRCRD